MASKALDVVARLQLRAEQFSSETGARFSELKTRARSAAQDVRDSFASSFAEVQKLAQTSLVLPRTETGSLNLSGEIAQLRSAAVASEQHAQALRELSIAQTAAAASGRIDAQAMLLEADASAVAALAEERHAQSLRERIIALEAVQAELNQTTSETRLMTAAAQQYDVTIRRSTQSTLMIGQQVQDFAIQVAGGQSVLLAFTQQASQAGLALVNMEGKLGAVGRFLTGGYGTAVLVALTATVPFVTKLLDEGAAAEEAEKKLRQAAQAADSFGNAQSLVGKVIDLTTGKLKTHNQVLIETIRLQAMAGMQAAREEQRQGRQALNQTPTELSGLRQVGAALSRNPAAYNPSALDAPELRQLFNDVNAGSLGATQARQRLQELERQGKTSGQTFDELFPKVLRVLQASNDIKANQDVIDALDGKGLSADLKPYERPKKPPKPKSTAARDEFGRDTADRLDELRNRFADIPPQAQQVERALNDVDDIIDDLARRKPPGFEKMIADAQALRPLIEDAINKPFRDFIDAQKESLAIGQLTLEGRDSEAAALQATFRLQEQMGPLTDQQLGTILKTAEQQERITRELDEQRRIVGLYAAAAVNVQRTFGQFLADLDGNTGAAIKNFGGNLLADFKSLRDSILSDQLFGGIDRDIEDYMRRLTGRRSPAELIEDQAGAAGAALRDKANSAGSALEDFATAVRRTTSSLSGAGAKQAGDLLSSGTLADVLASAVDEGATPPANDNDPLMQDIVVTGRRLVEKLDFSARSYVSATDAFNFIGGRFADRLEAFVGKLPPTLDKALREGLGPVLQGISLGQLGGSVFASITGGKQDSLASGIGGVLGETAGKELGKVITKEVGGQLGKTLGGIAGPLGGILGGVLGGLVGGLFSKAPKASAGVAVDQYGSVQATTAVGNNSQARSGAATLAGAVAAGINQIADLLGAKVTGTTDVRIGTYKDMIRVNDHGAAIGGVKGSGAITFETEEAAIAYAIADALKDGVLSGISQASLNILRSGQDLQKAIEKAVMIESIPKNLKAALDPVGAAVDSVNEKWTKIVDALKEGGATAEQMAQAQQLYNIELQQAKTQTPAAAQTLRDFLDEIRGGSNSPYSLREQEKTVLGKLQPFLDDINAGKSIDQSKFTEAANAAIDVERQLLGSTKGFFDFLDMVQAATSKAIADVENVAPIKPPVASPFEQATADNTAKAAAAAQTANEMTEETNELLRNAVDLLRQVVGTGGSFSDFIGQQRSFA